VKGRNTGMRRTEGRQGRGEYEREEGKGLAGPAVCIFKFSLE